MADPRPRLAVLDDPRVEVFQQVGGQQDPVLGEPKRVGPQVVDVHLRVVVQQHVLVGRVFQVGVGRPRGDLLELGGLVPFDRLVGVLDRPVVVGADRGGDVVALLLALGGDVDRVVVHHAARHTLDRA